MVANISIAAQSLARRQLGLLTRTQLTQAGVSADILRRRVATVWRMVLPGVVHLGRGDLNEDQRLAAAQLLVGPDGIVTGAAAAAWHGLRYAAPLAHVDVLVGPHRAARTSGFVVTRRSRRPPDVLRAAGTACVAALPRAIADACRFRRGERYATALVVEAVERRLCALQDLSDELHAGPTRDSQGLRHAIEAARTGAWSAPEHDLISIVSGSRSLPTPWPNPELRTVSGALLPSPDLWFDDVGLAVQVHSRTHHSSGPDWERTVRADSALAEAGILRISLTPSEIARAPGRSLRRIETLHASRGPAHRPPVVMLPRLPFAC